MRLVNLVLFFNIIIPCIDGEEVELWGECYHIDTTFYIDLSNSGLSGEIPSEIGQLINLSYLNLLIWAFSTISLLGLYKSSIVLPLKLFFFLLATL